MNQRALAFQGRWHESAAVTFPPRWEKNGSLQFFSNEHWQKRGTSTETCSYHMVVLQLSSCCQLKKDRCETCESVALANVRIHVVALASGHGRGRIGRLSVRSVSLLHLNIDRSLTLDRSTCIHERSNVWWGEPRVRTFASRPKLIERSNIPSTPSFSWNNLQLFLHYFTPVRLGIFLVLNFKKKNEVAKSRADLNRTIRSRIFVIFTWAIWELTNAGGKRSFQWPLPTTCTSTRHTQTQSFRFVLFE